MFKSAESHAIEQVRDAWRQIDMSAKRIETTRAARLLAEQRLDAERKRLVPRRQPPSPRPELRAGRDHDAIILMSRSSCHTNRVVRELRNALERAAILCEGGLIGAQHLGLHQANRPPQVATTDLNIVERDTIAQVMRDCRWNKSKAAQRLGLSRTQLYVRLRRYDLEQTPTPHV